MTNTKLELIRDQPCGTVIFVHVTNPFNPLLRAATMFLSTEQIHFETLDAIL